MAARARAPHRCEQNMRGRLGRSSTGANFTPHWGHVADGRRARRHGWQVAAPWGREAAARAIAWPQMEHVSGSVIVFTIHSKQKDRRDVKGPHSPPEKESGLARPCVHGCGDVFVWRLRGFGLVSLGGARAWCRGRGTWRSLGSDAEPPRPRVCGDGAAGQRRGCWPSVGRADEYR